MIVGFMGMLPTLAVVVVHHFWPQPAVFLGGGWPGGVASLAGFDTYLFFFVGGVYLAFLGLREPAWPFIRLTKKDELLAAEMSPINPMRQGNAQALERSTPTAQQAKPAIQKPQQTQEDYEVPFSARKPRKTFDDIYGMKELKEKLLASNAGNLSELPDSLLQWVIDHARAGVDADSVVSALTSNGWSHDDALLAVQQAISKFAPGYGSNPRVAELHTTVVPEPLLADGARSVDCGDRTVEVAMTALMPRVVVFDGFLSDKECDELIAQATPKLAPSTVIESGTGNGVLNDVRTSTGMFFQPKETPLAGR